MPAFVADPFRLAGTLLDGKYLVDRVVAEGGFGVVYAGHHLALDVRIAIKVLKRGPDGVSATVADDWSERLAQLLDEGRTIAKLRHPSIVAVLDSGVTHVASLGVDVPWLVLEWLDGSTLREDLARRRGGSGRSPRECMQLLRPVIEAIAAAHDAGIVHRDLKSSNIMLVPDGRGGVTARVLDFGIAKIMTRDEGSEAPSGDTATESRVSAFTAASAAPEQLSRSRTGPWTDVFALALLVTEALTDRAPMVVDDSNEHYRAIFAAERPTPARLGKDVGAWESILARALAVRPADRPANARALLAELDAALGAATTEGGVEAREPAEALSAESGFSATDRQAPRAAPRSRARWTIIGLAIVGALGASVAVVQARRGVVQVRPASATPPAPLAPSAPSYALRPLTKLRQPSTVNALGVSRDATRVAYVDRDGLWIAPIDDPSARIRVPMPAEVPPGTKPHQIDFFPDGTRLLLGSWSPARLPLFVVPIDGRPATRGRAVDDAWLAPDGERIAFISEQTLRVGSIDEGPSSRVAAVTEAFAFDAAWSPDGTRLALLRTLRPRDPTYLEIVRADGSLARTVHQSPDILYDEAGVTWSAPDRIAFFEELPSGEIALRELALDRDDGPREPPHTLFTGAVGDPLHLQAAGASFFYARIDIRRTTALFRVERGGLKRGASLDPLPGASRELAKGFLPDGRLLVDAKVGDTWRLVARPTGPGEPETLTTSTREIDTVGALANGDVVFVRAAESSGGERSVIVRSPDGGEREIFRLEPAREGRDVCLQCASARSDVCVVSEEAGEDAVVRVFDPTTGSRRPPFLRWHGRASLRGCSISRDGRTLTLPAYRNVQIVDIATGRSTTELVDADVTVNHVLSLTDGAFLLSGILPPGPPFVTLLMEKGKPAQRLWSSDSEYAGVAFLAPNARDIALRASAHDIDVWAIVRREE